MERASFRTRHPGWDVGALLGVLVAGGWIVTSSALADEDPLGAGLIMLVVMALLGLVPIACSPLLLPRLSRAEGRAALWHVALCVLIAFAIGNEVQVRLFQHADEVGFLWSLFATAVLLTMFGIPVAIGWVVAETIVRPRRELPPAAGWAPDPWGEAPYRWWDGSQWTQTVG